ncbi:MAG: PLDc N-terminal domain-containing protein [Clostridia bacterium]|nr:PLDc N-terminal domain-containing protein [Clostridia bacterium]MEE0409799.1 phospholipase D-like domain-containing protein [Clostridia bacterium]
MNKLLKLVYSNKFFAILTLLLQVGMIAMFIVGISNNVRFYLLASNLISTIFILIEVNRHEESAFKITWIMLIATVPYFGWFFYLYTHTGIISGNIRKSHERAKKALDKYRYDDSEIISEMDNAGVDTSLIKYLSRAGGSSVFKNTAVSYYALGDEMFKAITDELEKAEKFIFMEFFIINQKSYMWRVIEEILLRKAREGVDVRVMYDGMGCMGIVDKDYNKKLESMGIKCRIFSPLQPLLSTYQNNRDHRKVIVIDGRCAFSGGVNLADEYINKIVRFGHWKDTGIKLIGEGVSGFTELFLTMWCTTADKYEVDMGQYVNASEKYSVPEAKGYVVPFGDSPLDEKLVGRNAYVDILNSAKESVDIMTPYFVIDDAIYDAMSYAVTRGVRVRLILPGMPDKKVPYCLARSYYRDLFAIGVEVYEYIPGFVHAKNTVADGKRAIVGTINYDYRSLYLHYECGTYMIDVPEIKEIEQDFSQTLISCRRVTRVEHRNYPWYYRAAGMVLRFVATMI